MAKRTGGEPSDKGKTLRIDEPMLDSHVLADLDCLSPDDSVLIDMGKHRVECAVQKELLSHPSLHFTSLVVRRTPNGVCLEGMLEAGADSPDPCHLARSVAGVSEVINRLMVRSHSAAAKS